LGGRGFISAFAQAARLPSAPVPRVPGWLAPAAAAAAVAAVVLGVAFTGRLAGHGPAIGPVAGVPRYYLTLDRPWSGHVARAAGGHQVGFLWEPGPHSPPRAQQSGYRQLNVAGPGGDLLPAGGSGTGNA